AHHFGLTRTQFNYIKARHVSAVVKSDPYEVLGIAPDADDETLRSHYHKLVLENHPDRMIARGVYRRNLCLSQRRKSLRSMLRMRRWLKSDASEPSSALYPKMLNSTEDAHLKNVSTFETGEHPQAFDATWRSKPVRLKRSISMSLSMYQAAIPAFVQMLNNI